MYFHNFPEIEYDPTGSGNYNTIQDITTRIKVREWIINNGALFSKYIVSNGDTPEIVAFKEYGSTDYHWVVLLFNQIINNYYGWPLSRRNFDAFVMTVNILILMAYTPILFLKVLEAHG